MNAPDDDIDSVKKKREIEKLEIDIANAKKSLSLERLKAWASLLGPVMTAATVLGTVYIGFLQISSRADADEDANWRQTVSSLNAVEPGSLKARHVGTLLKPFLESKRYRTAAIGVTTSELPALRDVGTFKDLFDAAFPHPEAKDLPTLLDLARQLTQTQRALSDPDAKDAKHDEWLVVIAEVGTLCNPIAGILRNPDRNLVQAYLPSTPNALPQIPLNSIYFERCVFSDVDFSGVDLTDSFFDYAVLDGAILDAKMPRSADFWSGTIWWTAKAVDSDLLRYLIGNWKPYQTSGGGAVSYRDGLPIKPDDWIKNVRRLCANVHLECSEVEIRAQFPKDS